MLGSLARSNRTLAVQCAPHALARSTTLSSKATGPLLIPYLSRQQQQLLLLPVSQQSHSFVSLTTPCLEKKNIKVPTMGDSITEGTIVEWAATIGQAVQEGDVVVMVETDKVTVEIKAEVGGVVTRHFGAIDETVEVGSDLYEIDTDATASVDAAAPSETKPTPPPSVREEPFAAAATAASSSSSSKDAQEQQQHRTPSIKFLGKEGWAQSLSGASKSTTTTASSAPTPAPPAAPSSSSKTSSPLRVTVIYDTTIIHPMYGRPKFSDVEMEALILGGASVAPNVLSHSGGAKFK